MQKVIFLDIDGVLNTKYWDNMKVRDQYGHTFDPNSVANLARIIDKTGAEIVISSSWKCLGLGTLQKMWKDRKLPGEIIDVTPDNLSDELLLIADLFNMDQLYIRGCEIKGWLALHKDVKHYIIIDDMDDFLPEQQNNLILTDPNVGITEWNVQQAIMILNR